jgi:hypothetical protein
LPPGGSHALPVRLPVRSSRAASGDNGDVDREGAVIDAGDDEVGEIALAPIGQRDADACPTEDVGIDVEKACEVAGVLRAEHGRAGTFDGGKRGGSFRWTTSRGGLLKGLLFMAPSKTQYGMADAGLCPAVVRIRAEA